MPVQRPADVVIRLYLHGISRKELTRLARYTASQPPWYRPEANPVFALYWFLPQLHNNRIPNQLSNIWYSETHPAKVHCFLTEKGDPYASLYQNAANQAPAGQAGLYPSGIGRRHRLLAPLCHRCAERPDCAVLYGSRGIAAEAVVGRSAQCALRMLARFPEPPLAPPEPVRRGWCAWCGGEIYAGSRVYTGEGGTIHPDCALPLLLERLGAEYLAALCGYREEIA